MKYTIDNLEEIGNKGQAYDNVREARNLSRETHNDADIADIIDSEEILFNKEGEILR